MNELTQQANIVGLSLQCIGSILIATLFLVLTRSVRRADFASWSRAWLFLAVALSALLAALCLPLLASTLFAVYLLGSFQFAYYFLSGCRIFCNGAGLDRWQGPWLYVSMFAAVFLPFFLSFNLLFALQAGFAAVIYALGAWLILRARRRWPAYTGRPLLVFASCLLALNLAHYIPLCIYSAVTHAPILLFPHLEYSSLIELLMQVLLAFGMVVLVMEDVRAEVEATNHELNTASQRLQALAKRDPLTETLNRHAFESILRRSELATMPDLGDCATTPSGPSAVAPPFNRVFSGSVVVLDIDDLKPINDTYGHAAGDAAIREVAKAIRGVIRPDDLLFRWGGDEFLVILLGVSAVDARPRFERMQLALKHLSLRAVDNPIDLHVSFGIAPFEIATALDEAIEQADGEMYALKQSHKAVRKSKDLEAAR